MKALIAAAAALVLGGCGLPPAFTIASYALDGMTLFSTGKSVSGHALSAATKKDCAVWRVVKDEKVCREFKDGAKSRFVLAAERWERGGEIVGMTEAEPFVVRGTRSKRVMLALADPVLLPQFEDDGAVAKQVVDSALGIRLPAGPIAATFVAIERAPGPDKLASAHAKSPWLLPVGAQPVPEIERVRENTRSPRFVTPDAVQDAADPLAGAAAGAGQKVLVLGSFTRIDNARRAARQWSRFRPAIVRARVDGVTIHRVIVGSVGGDFGRRQRQLASLGQPVWAADICVGGTSDGRCVNMPAVLRR